MNKAAQLSPQRASLASFRDAVLLDQASTGIGERLCELGQPLALGKGAQMPTHDAQDQLVFVADGAAKLIANTAPDHVHVLAFHFAGDVVSVLNRSDGDFRLVALTPIELVAFPASPFFDLAQEEPVVLRCVLSRSLQALHRSRTKMMRLGHKSARQRLADFLLSMAQRLCGLEAGPCQMSLPMSRRDIAESLGLTIETVSRQFTELRELGLLETQGRSIVRMPDLHALAAEAGQTPQTQKLQET